MRMLKIFICFQLFLHLIHAQPCFEWGNNHQRCLFCAHSSIEASVSSIQGQAQCEDAAYVSYFNKILEQPPTEFHKKVAENVLNLYNNLIELRKPAVLINEEVPRDVFRTRGRKPAYYAISMQKNITTYPSINIFPISFGILSQDVARQVPPKSKVLGRVIPGNSSTYFSLDEESFYYADLRQSLMALTYKKGGWDCLRHYEILASGTLPLFVDIDQCPLHALRLHPRNIYKLILEFPGLEIENLRRINRMTYQFDRIDIPSFDPAVSHIDSSSVSSFDTALYVHLTNALIQYTQNVLSTKSLAQYVLQTMHENSEGKIKSVIPKSILYLSHEDHDMDKGDYLTDLLLLGFYELLGGYEKGKVVDFPRRDCLYRSYAQFGSVQYKQSKKLLYGSGFVFGHRIDAHIEPMNIQRDVNSLRKQLENHEFDIVILGSGHRDGWASTLHLWDTVCSVYDRREVAMVFGADFPLPRKILHRYAPCAAHIFSREGYEFETALEYPPKSRPQDNNLQNLKL